MLEPLMGHLLDRQESQRGDTVGTTGGSLTLLRVAGAGHGRTDGRNGPGVSRVRAASHLII